MTSVCVAGAGAFGLASALSLARAGFKVTVCDPARIGDNASGVAAGMLAPAFEALLDPLSAGHFSQLAEARSAWPAFAAGLGLPIERDGAIWAGGDAEAVQARLAALGARAQVISAAEAKAAVGGLSTHEAAVFTPEDWRLDPAAALLALRTAAEDAGCRFVAVGVRSFEPGTVVSDGAGRLSADLLVVATGYSQQVLAPEQGSLTPVKGHILRMGGGPQAGPVVRGDGVYVRPHVAGAVVGASMERDKSDREVDPGVVDGLLARAQRLFPDLKGAPHLAAAGVRATTEDGLPIVKASASPGVIVAIGARRNGWLLAPSVGERVVEIAKSKSAV